MPEKISQGEAIELVEARNRDKNEAKIQEEEAKINLSSLSHAEYTRKLRGNLTGLNFLSCVIPDLCLVHPPNGISIWEYNLKKVVLKWI